MFLADDLKFDPPRAVAIKILHTKFLNEPGIRHDISQEASILARFSHPNIIRVLDFDITPERAYIVTELAEGGSLAQKIRPDPKRPPVRMPLMEVVRYLEQISDGLDEAHDQGLIHRDLKPLNILLDRRNRPLIADFGMATAVSNSQSSVVIEANTSGTPPYMAPEQWMGQVSRSSDNYALGIITYQLLTGQVPFQGEQAALGFQHLNAPVPKLSDRAPDLIYPPTLDDVLAGVLAKDPRQRTRPALEFFNQFRSALGISGSLINSTQSLPVVPTFTASAGAVTASSSPVNPANQDTPGEDPGNSPTTLGGSSFEDSATKASTGSPLAPVGFGSNPLNPTGYSSQPLSNPVTNYASNPPGSTPSGNPGSIPPGSLPPGSINPARQGWPVRNLVLIGIGGVVVFAIVLVAIVSALGGKPDQSPTQLAAAPTNTAAATASPGSTKTPAITAASGSKTPVPTATTPKPKTTAANPAKATATPDSGKVSPTPDSSATGDAQFIQTIKMDSGGKAGGQLNYAFAGTGPNILNPYLTDVGLDLKISGQIYASLAGMSADAKYYAYLLTAVPTLDNGLIKVASDNKTMTMTLQLKPNAKWSDGSAMTSADLKYTWQWVTDKSNSGLKADTSGFSLVTDIDTPDASTAVLKFKQVYGPYLAFLANFYPLPQAVWSKISFKEDGPAKSPEATRPSVSSGPFTVEEYTAKDHVTFTRNSNFSWVWGFNAYLDKINFRWTDGSTASIKAFQAGTLDLVDNLGDNLVESATKAAGTTGKFEMSQELTWEFLQFNMSNPILQDKNVRQALLMGIDRDALIKQFYTPRSEPLATTCNPLNSFCTRGLKVYNYNVGTARKLLSDAGWDAGGDGIRSKNGTRLTISLNTTSATGPNAVADAIVAYWKDLGVEAKVITAPSGQFYSGWASNGVLKRGNFDVALYAYGTDLDPHSGFFSYVSDYIPTDATKGSGSNYGRVNDPKIDADFTTERTTVDLNKRQEAFHDFYQLMYDNLYEAALFSRTDNHLISNRVHNFKANPTSDGNLWNSVEIWLG